MNYSETFNRIYEYAKTMEKPAVDERGRCLYRSPHGPCLVGYILTDSQVENLGYNNIYTAVQDGLVSISAEDASFLQEIQNCHDRVAASPNWKQMMLFNLLKVKGRYSL